MLRGTFPPEGDASARRSKLPCAECHERAAEILLEILVRVIVQSEVQHRHVDVRQHLLDVRALEIADARANKASAIG